MFRLFHLLLRIFSDQSLKINYLLLAFSGFVACTPSPAKLGYVNSGQLMQHYHGTAAKQQEIVRLAAIWQRSLDSLTAISGRSATAAPTPQVAQFRTSLQQRIQAAGQHADEILLKEVNAYLKRYGQQNGL